MLENTKTIDDVYIIQTESGKYLTIDARLNLLSRAPEEFLTDDLGNACIFHSANIDHELNGLAKRIGEPLLIKEIILTRTIELKDR